MIWGFSFELFSTLGVYTANLWLMVSGGTGLLYPFTSFCRKSVQSHLIAGGRLEPLLCQCRLNLRLAQSVWFDDPTVGEMHRHALAGALLHVEAFTLFSDAMDKNDRSAQANRLLRQGDAEWQAWAVQTL